MNRIKFCFLLLPILIMSLSCTKAKNDPEVEKISKGVEIVNIESYKDYIIIGWEAIPGATKYEVKYAKTADMKDATVMETKTISVRIGDLSINQDYFWQTRGSASDLWSDWSVAKRIATASFEVSVGTYNILGAEYDPDVPPEYAWNLRKDAVRDIILQPNNNPDIIGLQECSRQYEDVVLRLSASYDSHISNRDVSARLIFWKRDKFELVSFDDNIDIFGSKISGYDNRRYITQVRLKEKQTGKEFFVYNIHLPAGSAGVTQSVRGVGAETVAGHAKLLSNQFGIPAIVLGDFNNYNDTYIEGFPPSPVIFQNNGLVDAFDITLHKVNNNYGTVVNKATSTAAINYNNRRHLDYILGYPRNLMAVTEHAVIINFLGSSSTQLVRPVPSDHHPVRVVMQLSY